MRFVTSFLVLAALGATTGVIFQARAIREAKVEAASGPGDSQNATPAQPDAAARDEMERLRGEARDLLKLRNEVRQLRSRSSELTQAMAENARLQQMQQLAAAAPNSSAALVEGFTARDALAESGLATPETAMQSFFRAGRDGDVKRFLECVSSNFPMDFENPNQVAQFTAKLREMLETLKDVRIVERKDVSPERVVLGLQSSVGPAIMHMTFQKVGNQWLVERPY